MEVEMNPDLFERLVDFVERLKSLSPEESESALQSPVLVVEMDESLSKTRGFRTILPHEDTRPREPGDEEHVGGEVARFVASLEKSGRNTFQGMITVGRSTNNDIVLNHDSISKFHGVFRCDTQSGEFKFTDVGSSNGTFIHGRRIEANAPQPVASGTAINFAGVAMATVLRGTDIPQYIEVLKRAGKL
jgi:hypothetical protein